MQSWGDTCMIAAAPIRSTASATARVGPAAGRAQAAR